MNNIIFIISQPRSGSTLLQKILENNSEIQSNDETWLSLMLMSLLNENINIEAEYDFSLARNAVSNFLDNVHLRDDFEHSLVSIINEMYTKSVGKATYFLEKTPRNYFILESLHKFFPNAKFIILTRNPAAVMSSLLASWHNNNLEAVKMHYNDLVTAPKKIHAFAQEHSDFFHVAYEDLVFNPENILESLSNYLSLKTPLNNTYTVAQEIAFGDNIGIYKSNKAEITSLEKWKSDSSSQLCLYYWYLTRLSDEIKTFFFHNEHRLNETIAYLTDYKDFLPVETIESLLSQPMSIEEQLIEKEAVIQEKEKAIQELYKHLAQKEEMINTMRTSLEEVSIFHQFKKFIKGR